VAHHLEPPVGDPVVPAAENEFLQLRHPREESQTVVAQPLGTLEVELRDEVQSGESLQGTVGNGGGGDPREVALPHDSEDHFPVAVGQRRLGSDDAALFVDPIEGWSRAPGVR
jgi:hypothetical protein